MKRMILNLPARISPVRNLRLWDSVSRLDSPRFGVERKLPVWSSSERSRWTSARTTGSEQVFNKNAGRSAGLSSSASTNCALIVSEFSGAVAMALSQVPVKPCFRHAPSSLHRLQRYTWTAQRENTNASSQDITCWLAHARSAMPASMANVEYRAIGLPTTLIQGRSAWRSPFRVVGAAVASKKDTMPLAHCLPRLKVSVEIREWQMRGHSLRRVRKHSSLRLY